MLTVKFGHICVYVRYAKAYEQTLNGECVCDNVFFYNQTLNESVHCVLAKYSRKSVNSLTDRRDFTKVV